MLDLTSLGATLTVVANIWFMLISDRTFPTTTYLNATLRQPALRNRKVAILFYELLAIIPR